MARILIVGCGCRGQLLASELVKRGHAVRGTTRDQAKQAAIEAVGAEYYNGDPDRVVTLMDAFQGVAVVCWLLGSAVGEAEELAALHGTRLEMALERMTDTGIRGVVYEAAGSIEGAVLTAGAMTVRMAGELSHIPTAVIETDSTEYQSWLAAVLESVEDLL